MTELLRVKPDLAFPVDALRDVLTTPELVLFFGKLYDLDARQLAELLRVTVNSDVVSALTAESGYHSADLQDYVVELGFEYMVNEGDITFSDQVPPPQGEILPEMWKMLEVEIAKSIKDVAAKLSDVVGHMPGKHGKMVFASMMTVNAKRPILGDYKAKIQHTQAQPNLVILDVSGSMSERTVETIVSDVVALSYMADAHLAIVSNNTTHWPPGGYSVQSVLSTAEYGGTHYETLAPLFDQHWGSVVTIADYDSSWSAKDVIAECTGSIEQVLDISLVSRPSFLGEVVGQLSQQSVRPLLIAANNSCCM